MPLAKGEISGNRSERRGVSERGMRIPAESLPQQEALFQCAGDWRGRRQASKVARRREGGSVFFRRILPLVALLFWVAGCASPSGPGATVPGATAGGAPVLP